MKRARSFIWTTKGFVGGSTRWKDGPHAARLIQTAKACGRWVHVGRVSTLRRWQLMSALGVDSIDSTAFSRWPDTNIPWMLRRLHVQQHGMLDILGANP